MAKQREYFSQAVPTLIRATSRVSVKLNESFYTFEFQEERAFPIDLVEDGQINFEREQWTTNFPEIFKAVQTEIKERCPGYDIAGFVLLPEEEKILSKKQGGKHHENDDKILSLLRKKNTT